MIPPADCPITPAEQGAKPLRSYLDRALFGAVALLLLWNGSRMESYGNKLEANTQEITALRERVEGLREGMKEMKERVATLERISTLKEKHDGR